MAVKTLYLLNTTAVTPNWFGSIQDSGSAPAAAAAAFGWAVAKNASPVYWRPRIGATATLPGASASATSYVGAATFPVAGTGATNATSGDSFISPTTYSGTFPAGNWVLNFGMRTGAATCGGRVLCKLWAGTNANGTGAREITSGTLTCSTITLNATATTFTSTITWAAPAITLINEYLFVMPEWQETSQGTSNSSSVLFYQSAGTITTTNFAPGTFGSLGLTQAAQTISAAGNVPLGPVTGTLALTQEAQTGRTNWVRNPRAEGAVAGTPGTAPTNWGGWGPATGLSETIVGTGVEDGLQYIEVRIFGTRNGTGFQQHSPHYFETTTAIPAVQGQSWAVSFYARLVGGTATNINNVTFGWDELNSVGGIVTTYSANQAPPTSTPSLRQQRYTGSITTNLATTAYVRPYWTFLFSGAGTAIDITLRIAAPQQEQGTSATNLVLPPVGAPGKASWVGEALVSAFGVLALTQEAQFGRTNLVRNPRAEGAVAGTPGTAPTFWTLPASPSLTQSIIGSGVEAGIPYIDIRLSGTAPTFYGNTARQYFETNNSALGAKDQNFSLSLYVRLVGGSTTNLDTFTVGWEEYNGVGTSLTIVNNSYPLPDGSPLSGQRKNLNGYTVVNAATVYLRPYFTMFVPNAGGAIDLTLRFGSPQLELAPYASPPLLPPIGTPGVSGPRIGTGGPVVRGTLALTEAGDTLSAAGTVFYPVTGTLAKTEDGDTISAAGTVGTVASYKLVTSYSPSSWRANFDGIVGVSFIPSVAMTFNRIGLLSTGGSGWSGRRQAYLFDNANPGTLLANAAVDLTGTTFGTVYYTNMLPVTLTAGNRYELQTGVSNDGTHFWADQSAVTMRSDVGSIFHAFGQPFNAQNHVVSDLMYFGLDLDYDPTLTYTRITPVNMTAASTPSPYVVTTSSAYPGGYEGWQAFDGNPSTMAHGANTLAVEPWWIKIDLGSSQSGSLYKYVPRNDDSTTQWRDWVLEGSNNDSTWTLVDTTANQFQFAPGEGRTYVCNAPGTYRYWRWTVTAAINVPAFPDYASVGALEIWGATAYTGPPIGTLVLTEASDTISAAGTVAEVPGTLYLVSSFTPGSDRNNYTGGVGFAFTLAHTETYNRIGVRKGTGNTGVHNVGLYIWNSAPTPLETLRTATIDLTGGTVGNFYYTDIAAIGMTTGFTYALLHEVVSGDGQFWADHGATTLNNSGGIINYAARDSGSWGTAGSNEQYAGLDLSYVPGADVTGSLTLHVASQTISAAGTVVSPVVTGTLNITQAEQAGRTNRIVNPRAEGAVAGTPGTIPTNWWTIASGGPTITTQIVGTGTENGIPYIDVHWFGDTGTGANTYIRPLNPSVRANASTGQTWFCSNYARLVAGSFTNVNSCALNLYSGNNGFLGTLITATGISLSSFTQPGGLTTRYSAGGVVASTTHNSVTSSLDFLYPGGAVPVDFTLRFGAPQLELNEVTGLILPPVGSPGVTSWEGTATVLVGGTLGITEAGDTISAAGTVSGGLAPVTGTLALTQANQGISANATVLVGGTLGITEIADTLSAAGTVVFPVRTATLALTQANQTISAAGTVLVGGTLGITEALDTIAAAATVLATGTLARTQADQTIAAQGKVLVGATLSRTQADHTLAGVAGPVAGAALNLAQAPQTISAQGGVTVRGTLGITEALDTISAAGSVLTGVGGALNLTQAAQTLSAAGTVPLAVIGTLGIVQANQTIVAAGGPRVGGTLGITQADQTISAAGTIGVAGTLGITQAPQTLAAQSRVLVGGTLGITEIADTIASNASVAVGGTLALTEAGDTLSAAGTVVFPVRTATLALTQASQTISAAGTVLSGIAGTLNLTQANQTISAAGTVPLVVTGTLGITEALDTISAAGTIAVAGTLGILQAPQTLAAQGRVLVAGMLTLEELIDTIGAAGSVGVGGSLLQTQAPHVLSAYASVGDTGGEQARVVVMA